MDVLVQKRRKLITNAWNYVSFALSQRYFIKQTVSLQHVAHILGGNATAPRDMPMAAPSGADSFAESLAGSLCSRTSSLSIARPRPRPSGSVLVSPAPMSLVVSPKVSASGH